MTPSVRRAGVALVAALLCSAPASLVEAQFSYLPPGNLISGSGTGRVDTMVYAPSMRFPIESAPAFANSQVYRPGGSRGGPGGQCASSNYDYPWQDNYCESRGWSMPLCPVGTGHQGQDIRPGTCVDNTHWAVAAVDGRITNIGSFSVYLTGDDGRRYDYLHMRSVAVSFGERVTRGQRLGRVSNAFGSSSTTIHLHFNIRMNVSGLGSVYAPPYMSLVRSYEELLGVSACASETEACDARDNDCDGAIDEGIAGGCGGSCTPTAVAGAESELFVDLPRDAFGWAEAGMLFREGITNGCSSSPRMFCPKCPITRAQMVVFMIRAAGISTAGAPATPTFSDVPTSHPFYDEVEAAAREGITTGCGGGQFCPDDNVTRGQVAAFIRRTTGWPTVAGAMSFTDVPDDHLFYGDVETIYEHCVTYGCAAGRYCPDDDVTRAHAAVFIARAFNLEDSNACLIESCNGEDDDVDGTVDEGVTSACGDCASVPSETCNGVDDDCDGDTDEGVSNACGGCGAVPTEVCNGIDDDCDDTTDEGCPGVEPIDAGGADGSVADLDGGGSTAPRDSGTSVRPDAGEGASLTGDCGCRALGRPDGRGSIALWMLVGLALARRRPRRPSQAA